MSRPYKETGYIADAPDGKRAFVYASRDKYREDMVSCDTSAFAKALGFGHSDFDEVIDEIVNNGNPNVIGAIIETINAGQ